MSIFKKKSEDTTSRETVVPSEVFDRILQKLTVEQEASIREAALRYWTLRDAAGSSVIEQMEACEMYLMGYMQGLESCGAITEEEKNELRRVVMGCRFSNRLFESLTMRERGML